MPSTVFARVSRRRWCLLEAPPPAACSSCSISLYFRAARRTAGNALLVLESLGLSIEQQHVLNPVCVALCKAKTFTRGTDPCKKGSKPMSAPLNRKKPQMSGASNLRPY